MRLVKFATLVLLAFVVTGCACRTKKVGADGNIPLASDGGPLADINFDFDRYAITDAAKATLAANAEWLKANPGANAQVEGHCDVRGTNEYNMALGMKRANSASSYLRSLGVEASRLSTVSYGEDLPLDPALNEEAYAMNRRAHFKVDAK